MTPADSMSRPPCHRWRAWPVWGAPVLFRCYLFAIEFAAVAAGALALTTIRPSLASALRAALIVGLAVIFEELVSKASRLRIKLSEALKPDMTSAWLIPAIVVLPLSYMFVCVCALLGYVWLRQQRPSGEQAYRKLGTAATILVACVVAHEVMTLGGRHLPNAGNNVSDALTISIALLVFLAVNRSLVTVALCAVGVTGRALLGSREDNLVEFATVCLGGLVVLAVVHQPALSVLVLLPMVLLQRGALMRQLEHAATTDSKTGLLNAIAWEQLAQRELTRSDRVHSVVAVLILDIDRFKAVNDTHGHLAGDAVLQGIATQLTTELRGYDIVGRFGGEEFVALVPIGSEQQAITVAERLRHRINQLRVSDVVELTDATTDSQLAVSIGIACSPTDGTDLTELLHAADQALYTAKNTGRNRVTLAHRGEGHTPTRESV